MIFKLGSTKKNRRYKVRLGNKLLINYYFFSLKFIINFICMI